MLTKFYLDILDSEFHCYIKNIKTYANLPVAGTKYAQHYQKTPGTYVCMYYVHVPYYTYSTSIHMYILFCQLLCGSHLQKNDILEQVGLIFHKLAT